MTRLTRRLSLLALLGSAVLAAPLVATSAAVPAAATVGPAGDQITQIVERMTLEEKVGQLFVLHVYGDEADEADPDAVAENQRFYGVDNAAELIDRYHIGGVIYYTWSGNLRNPQQIAELSNGIQRAAMAQRVPVPALISTDQEHGRVIRITAPATRFPGNMALGAGRRPQDARAAARMTGWELRAMGINQNFAPVADVNVNPLNPIIGDRSFGSEAGLVADMTAAAVDGYRSAGVAATAKHFPGHGDTDTDSHTGVPIINHTRDQWEQIDQPPFAAAVDRDIDAIMTAHIIVPALDDSRDPATLSGPIMTGILRQEMGYDGVVVTDALGMQGVRDKYGDERVPVLALQAGVDQLLKPPDEKFPLQYEAVLEAVRSGEISQQRIDRSVARILALKQQLGLFRSPYVEPSRVDRVVGKRSHLMRAQRITDRTVTLVKNDPVDDNRVLPLPAGERSVLVTGWGNATTKTLADRITQRNPDTDLYTTGPGPTQEEIDAAVARARTHDVTVVTTGRVRTDEGQQRLVDALVATGKPVVAVAVREPYDIAYFTGVPAYLATYSYTGVALESVTRVLFGEASPRGKLPVTIPEAGNPDEVLYPYGHGLTY